MSLSASSVTRDFLRSRSTSPARSGPSFPSSAASGEKIRSRWRKVTVGNSDVGGSSFAPCGTAASSKAAMDVDACSDCSSRSPSASSTGTSSAAPAPRARVPDLRASSSSTVQLPAPSGNIDALFKLLWQERNSFEPLNPELGQRIRQRMDAVEAKDLGVSPSSVAGLSRRSGIGYQEVYSGTKLTLCIFLLRAGMRLPLHDHPGMCVFGRLLFGRMQVISYDLLANEVSSSRAHTAPHLRMPEAHDEEDHHDENDDLEQSSEDDALGDGSMEVSQEALLMRPRHSKLASGRSEEIYGPHAMTYVLEPYWHNAHELQAIDDCAFFDVVAPPYDARSGRDCTYYSAYRISPGDNHTVAVGLGVNPKYVLCPTRPAAAFSTERVAYRGPAFPPRAEDDQIDAH